MYRNFIYIAAIAVILTGCNKNTEVKSEVQPQDVPEIEAAPQQPEVTEPENTSNSQDDDNKDERPPFAWEMLTDVCPVFDENWRFDEIKDRNEDFYESAEPKTCLDGKEYCYGMDSRPILKPENEAGWQCRLVQKLPRSHTIPNTYYDPEPYLGFPYPDDFHRIIRTPKQWSFMKAWVCTEDACACGNKTCPLNGICIDGDCYCNDAPYKKGECQLYWKEYHEPGYVYDDGTVEEWPNTGGTSKFMMGDGDYYGQRFTSCKDINGRNVEEGNECTDEETHRIYCGKTQITNKSIQHCIELPNGQTVIYYDESDEGDFSNYLLSRGMFSNGDIQAQRKANADNKAYKCGNETCVREEVCLNNHCVGLGTRTKLPNNDYTWHAFMPECTSESGCICAKQKCTKGQFCIDAVCKDSPYHLKVSKNWVQYGIVGSETGQWKRYDPNEDKNKEDEKTPEFVTGSGIQPPTSTIWFDILTDSKSQTCDGASIPPNAKDYMCLFESSNNGWDESTQSFVGARGFYCINPNGCACGKNTCPMHAQCSKGACIYDAVYLSEACHRSDMWLNAQNFRQNNRFVDARGWCYCGNSLVPPNLPGYACDDDIGLSCKRPEGCPWGDVTCAEGDLCILPGKCQKP